MAAFEIVVGLRNDCVSPELLESKDPDADVLLVVRRESTSLDSTIPVNFKNCIS